MPPLPPIAVFFFAVSAVSFAVSLGIVLWRLLRRLRDPDREVIRRCKVCGELTGGTVGDWHCATPELHPGGSKHHLLARKAPLWVRLCCRLGVHLSRHTGFWETPTGLSSGQAYNRTPGTICDNCGDFHPVTAGRPLSWVHPAEVAPLWGGWAPALERGQVRLASSEVAEKARLPRKLRRALARRDRQAPIRGSSVPDGRP